MLKGPFAVAVEDVEDARIEAPTDAVVRVTSAAICGSDVHMYAGRTAAQPGLVIGHEPLGVVEEVGASIASVRPGDRVVVPFNISCGFCFNCKRGYTSACLSVNPGVPGGAYGYVGLGPYRGAQAERLRVPYADQNCLKVPGTPGDRWEEEFVLLADVFPTGDYANDLAGVEAGSTVAVFGAGPVGLLAAHCALLRGASEVYVVDRIPERLQKAEEIGALPIDFSRGDPVEQILEARRPHIAPGEDKMPGVMCGIEAVGYQAIDWANPSSENPTVVLEALIHLVNPTGRIGAVGLYVPHDPGGINPHAKRGEFRISFGKLWEKGLSLGTGQTPVARYAANLRDLIVAGRAKPSFVVSHRAPLEEAPGAYARFEKRVEGYTKVILKPSSSTHARPRGAGHSVLVAEDDDDLLGLIGLVLKAEGYDVWTARDGREALARLTERMPDLILLDMRMPVMNGWEFASEYRRLYGQHPRRAPIVVVTAAEHVAKRAREIHAEGYLAKPFTPDELAQKIQAVVAPG